MEIAVEKLHDSVSPPSQVCEGRDNFSYCYSYKCFDAAFASSDQSFVPRQEHQSTKTVGACHPIKSNGYYQSNLPEGVATGIISAQHQHHIVHCQFHHPCVANVFGFERADHFAHLSGQQSFSVLNNTSEATLDLEPSHGRTQEKLDSRGVKSNSLSAEKSKHSKNFTNRNQRGNTQSNGRRVHWDLDSKTQPQLLAQDSSILDYSLGAQPSTEKKPKNGICKLPSQVNQLFETVCDSVVVTSSGKITLQQENSGPDHHLGGDPSSDKPGTDRSNCETLSRSNSSGASSVTSSEISGTSSETSSGTSSDTSVCSGSDSTLVGPQDVETDSWLDLNPDYWEEIQELPVGRDQNQEHSTNPDDSDADTIQDHSEEESKECVTQRICDSLLSSGSYSSVDSAHSGPRLQKTRKICFADSANRSEHSKQKVCDRKSAASSSGRKSQGVSFQWTDFDIDASLEFIRSEPRMVAKSQDFSDSEEQQQKELQLAAELQFMPGDKCQVTLEGYNQMFNAHIQDLAPNRGPVSVFVEDLGEKHTVPYSSLKSLIQSYSQGWSPVKNLPGQHQKSPGESDSPRKTKGKKRKDMPVLITPSSRGTGLPPRLMALEARSGKISASQRNTNAIGGRQQQQLKTDRQEMATQDAADISLEKAVEESLTLYELQERDPAAFPALPNRQEEDGPKSFWSGAKETETTTKSSQEDYTLMNKVHSSERIESENAAHNYQRAVLRSTVTPGGGFTGSENGPITTSPPAAPVLPHSQIAMPQGFGTQQQYSPSPSVLPYMPLLMVPHTDSMGPINYNAVPSVDRTGSDLPHNDPSTMRFFFNLGCEYFRVTSMVQMQNQQSVQQPPVTPTQAQNIPQVTLGPPMGTTYFTNMYHTGGPVSASLQPNLDVTTPPVTIETPVTMMMQPEEHMTSQATSQMLLPGYNQSAMITNSQSGQCSPSSDSTNSLSSFGSSSINPEQGQSFVTSDKVGPVQNPDENDADNGPVEDTVTVSDDSGLTGAVSVPERPNNLALENTDETAENDPECANMENDATNVKSLTTSQKNQPDTSQKVVSKECLPSPKINLMTSFGECAGDIDGGGCQDSGCVSDVSSGVGDMLCSGLAPDDAGLGSEPQSPVGILLEDPEHRCLLRSAHGSESSDTHSDSSSQHSLSNISSISTQSDVSVPSNKIMRAHTSRKGKYGVGANANLVRPLKDFPPRFQKIISQNPNICSEKFEGPALIRQGRQNKHLVVPLSPSTTDTSLSSNDEALHPSHQFNPNAQSFVPHQPYATPDMNNGAPCTQATVPDQNTYYPGYDANSGVASNVGVVNGSYVPVAPPNTSYPPPAQTSVSGDGNVVYADGSVSCGDGEEGVNKQTGVYYQPPTYQNAPTYTIHIINVPSSGPGSQTGETQGQVNGTVPTSPTTACSNTPALSSASVGYQVAPQGTNAVSGGDGIVYAAQQPSAQHQQFPPQGAVYYSNPTASYPLPTQPGVGSPPQQYNPYMSYPVPNMVPGQVQMIATSVPAGSVSGAAAHPGSVVYSHVPSANVNVSPPQQQQQQPPQQQQQQQTSQQHQQQQQAAAAQFASLPPPPPPGAAGPAPLVQPSAPYTPQSAPNVQQVFSYTA